MLFSGMPSGKNRREQLASEAAWLVKNLQDLSHGQYLVNSLYFLTDYVYKSYIPEKRWGGTRLALPHPFIHSASGRSNRQCNYLSEHPTRAEGSGVDMEDSALKRGGGGPQCWPPTPTFLEKSHTSVKLHIAFWPLFPLLKAEKVAKVEKWQPLFQARYVYF